MVKGDKFGSRRVSLTKSGTSRESRGAYVRDCETMIRSGRIEEGRKKRERETEENFKIGEL